MTMKAMVMCLTVGIILCFLIPSTLAQATQISVEPSRLEVSQGENFTVNIMVNPAGSEVMSAQYDLHFDNTLLNVVDQSKGTFLSHDGASTINILKNINNTGGWVEYGEMRTGVTNGVTTSGILASITFQAVAEQGVSELHLKDVKVSDPNAKPVVSIEVNNGTCNIIEQTPTQTPTSEPRATATTPAQTIRTPDANRTSSPPLNAPTTPTAVQTPGATQTTTPTSRTTSTTPPQTIHTPAEKGLPGFEASLTIAWMLAAFIIRGKVMKK